jgi:maleylpyruvate isomerase
VSAGTATPDGRTLSASIEQRTTQIVGALRDLDDGALRAPSQLDGWSLLTIACHLRYGAEALALMTRHAMVGVPTSYYPDGRAHQRPSTLVPRPGESGADVVASLATCSHELARLWSTLSDDDWTLEGSRPGDTFESRSFSLAELALLRLTECEVHGSDLGLGLDDWSPLFVSVALPFRVALLRTRRLDQPGIPATTTGTWLLIATDGPTHVVSVTQGRVQSQQCPPNRVPATAAIEATSRDLLALLLGRSPVGRLSFTGDVAFGHSFIHLFPGP